MRIALILLLLAQNATTAATFQGGVDFSFQLYERINGVAQVETAIAQMPITLETDYSSISWYVDFSDQVINISGGLDQPFETTVEVNGRIGIEGPLSLSFPNSGGTAAAGYAGVTGTGLTYSVTNRIVSAVQTRESNPADVTSTPTPITHSINVADALP
jgi:hypothetical protein